jgi:Tfp pilus assembly protein PilO
MSRATWIAAGVTLLIAVALVMFLVLPKMNDVDEARATLQEAEEQELILSTELSRLQAVAEEAQSLRREAAEFRRQVPEAADLPGLINILQDAADRAEVDFFSVAPGEPAPTTEGTASEIPAQIQVIGSFFAVDEFLVSLETLERASKVLTLTVAAGPEGLPQLSVDLDTRFFTTDVSSGPGATEGGAPTPGETTAPAAGTSPAPATSPPTTGSEAALPAEPGA